MIRLPSARCAMLIAVFCCAVPSRAEQPDAAIPVPAPRPAVAPPDTAAMPDAEADQDASPLAIVRVPLPKRRPKAVGNDAEVRQAAEPEDLSAEEAACRDRLTAMGVRFTPADRIDGAGGCGISHPIRVTWLPQQVKLSGRAVMGCAVSESLARWTVKVALPQARQQFGQKLTMIEQYASYACRSRNSQSGRKLSEHAKGNAIDLGRFHLANGAVIDVATEAKEGTPEKRFLTVLRDEGCAYFKTVLGPGSDPYHDTHFHFDVANRQNGFRYCR